MEVPDYSSMLQIEVKTMPELRKYTVKTDKPYICVWKKSHAPQLMGVVSTKDSGKHISYIVSEADISSVYLQPTDEKVISLLYYKKTDNTSKTLYFSNEKEADEYIEKNELLTTENISSMLICYVIQHILEDLKGRSGIEYIPKHIDKSIESVYNNKHEYRPA